MAVSQRMRRTSIMAAAAFVVATTAAAADPSVQTLVDSCAVCHGTDGKAPRDGLGRLAGMSQSEFVSEMNELQQRTGEGRLMGVIAHGYTAAQIRAMGAYFAKQR